VSAPPRVLLDACVLFPPLVRSILIESAATGVFMPLWSARVFEEWRIAVGRKHGVGVEAEVVATQNGLRERFPDSEVSFSPDLEAQISLPDPADAHVLAAAVEGKADLLLTFNLRDFPSRTLEQHGVVATHPDGFLWGLLSDAPEVLSNVVNDALNAADIEVARRRNVLKRAKLPRLAKALDSMAQR